MERQSEAQKQGKECSSRVQERAHLVCAKALEMGRQMPCATKRLEKGQVSNTCGTPLGPLLGSLPHFPHLLLACLCALGHLASRARGSLNRSRSGGKYKPMRDSPEVPAHLPPRSVPSPLLPSCPMLTLHAPCQEDLSCSRLQPTTSGARPVRPSPCLRLSPRRPCQPRPRQPQQKLKWGECKPMRAIHLPRVSLAPSFRPVLCYCNP